MHYLSLNYGFSHTTQNVSTYLQSFPNEKRANSNSSSSIKLNVTTIVLNYNTVFDKVFNIYI